MLRPLKLMPSQFKAFGYVPRLMRPLIEAAERGLDPDRAIRDITQRLGFDSFMYGICLDPLPGSSARQFVYTTLPLEWVRTYEAKRYIDIDPRVRHITIGTLPIVWDQTTYRGRSPALDRFLDDSAAHGVGSGVCVPIRDARRRPAVMALSKCCATLRKSTIDSINERYGDIMVFSQFLHEMVMVPSVDRMVGPPPPTPNITPREREFLEYGARGLSGRDIALCMKITVRTVQLHSDSIRLKLGAANRQEAVALAIKQGIIVV